MPSPSPDALSPAEREMLLDAAVASIRSGLDGGPASLPEISALPDALQAPGAAFVTLRVGGILNGCIGTMEPREPLARTVARVAWEAAFTDPRLPALRREDVAELRVEISVLSSMEPMPAASREQLLKEMRPGLDGVLIEAGSAHATLLPAVWEEVADPKMFLALLLRKAGLRAGSWPAGLRAYRYTATEFGRDFTAPNS